MDKNFNFKKRETELYQDWKNDGYFACDPSSDKKGYTVMMPPPNITGSLHLGHALYTIQDLLCRFKRARGYDVLWQPGQDHASIAVHMVLEKQFLAKGTNRFELGREKFLERAWEWREESGNNISGQFERLGFSADWSRERFTLDEGLNKAVRKAFVKMYKDGLIYRDKRLVNWDVERQTAISDIEIKYKPINGKMWYINYPLEDGDEHITVATTRPETMLGDSGVVVHPDDERYQKLIGKHAILPIVGRKIPILADTYADMESGSGAVKMTPAHDFNDFEIGRRHDLEVINIFDSYARINENAPEDFQGLSREDARDAVVTKLEELSLLEKVEDHQMTIPVGERSGVLVEPYLTDQWYVDTKKLAKPAIDAVRNESIQFHPKQWENTYFSWMEDIQPWCISRQLWWGHQIPIWYGEDGHCFCAETEAQAYEQARTHYGKDDIELTQDQDILDTWFSSGLWSFSTLGWPENTEELAKYYPTDVLCTGFDIIPFWVARMIMMSTYFMDDVPFKDVYITSLIRDNEGQKMSKSKGNIVNPIDVIDEYGADALRFFLVSMSAQGRDINIDMSRIEGYRNFGTKLWNAARYAEHHKIKVPESFDISTLKAPINRWIVASLNETIETVTQGFENYRFNDACQSLYQFIWNTFCDWYIEFSKPALYGDDETLKQETKDTLGWVLHNALVLLHPIKPFITDEIYRALHDTSATIANEAWPEAQDVKDSLKINTEIQWVIDLIQNVRNLRSSLNLPAGDKLTVVVEDKSGDLSERLSIYNDQILQMARLESLDLLSDANKPEKTAQIVWGTTTAYVDVEGLIDVDLEMKRIEDKISEVDKDIQKFSQKLANENFRDRAPQDVVEKEQKKLEEAESVKTKLNEIYERLQTIA